MKKLLFFLFFIFPFLAKTQNFAFVLTDSLEIWQNNSKLSNAWAGGLNCPQFSKIDLNLDGKEDLFVFDRTNSKISTFLNVNNRFLYAPNYENFFPILEGWALLADYNFDGKKDLFTPSNFGVKFYKNTSQNLLNFSLAKDPILTTSLAGNPINLKIDFPDIPAITDIDNDGDLDILNFLPSVGLNIEFHRNKSMELFGKPDSLIFEKADNRWGEIEECSRCNGFLFGDNYCRTERTEHVGSTLLALDMDNDNDKDLLIGTTGCKDLVVTLNEGNAQKAKFRASQTNFPAQKPANFHNFPAAYFEDVDFDGIKDLLVCPNTTYNEGNLMNFVQSVAFYKNIGTNSKPDFQFKESDFLQNSMLDLGEETHPVAVDVDADGDLDLLVSNAGAFQNNGVFAATITFLENIGTPTQAKFRVADKDFLNFSLQNLGSLKITCADLNNDKAVDLAFTAINLKNRKIVANYLLNQNSSEKPLRFGKMDTLAVDLRFGDELNFWDIDQDQDQDLMVGVYNGGLKLYENIGNLTFELKNSDLGKFDQIVENSGMSLAIGDVNRDQKPDLFVANQGGELKLIDDFTQKLNEKWTFESNFVQNTLKKQTISHHFGRGFYPTFFGKNLILGTNAGGLQYLSYLENVPTNLETENLNSNFEVFPNPANQILEISANDSGTIQIFSVLGQKIFEKNFTNSLKIDVNHYQSGIYVLKFFNAKIEIFRKILLQH
ncbi:MAG: T9SS C-terminal target domain-containing protein [Bacteroidetes bacterium]|nr:MAG: T9SS C-terminal target domain-containing protein [Bacteroidota bacterium]